MVGDRAAACHDRVGRRPLGFAPLLDLLALTLPRQEREVERGAGLVDVGDVAHHDARGPAALQRPRERLAHGAVQLAQARPLAGALERLHHHPPPPPPAPPPPPPAPPPPPPPPRPPPHPAPPPPPPPP